MVMFQVIENQKDHVKAVLKRRRQAWLKNISRKNWNPGPGARVCSAHFILSKPSLLMDKSNPNWAPTKTMGHDEVIAGDSKRYGRRKRRESTREIL